MNNGLKKAAVFGLSACLLLGSLTGCSKKEVFDAAAAAAEVNGDQISAGLVKFATHYNQALTEGLYASMGATFNQDLGNGATLGQMIREQTVTELEQMVLAEQKMEEYDVALTDEEKTSIAEAATAFMSDNEEEVLEKMGATQETVERYLTLNAIRNKVEEQMVADVDTEVSDEEAAQRKIQYALFVPSTEEETEAESETETEAAETETEAGAANAAEGETEAAETDPESETAALTEEETVKTQAAAETETEAADTEAAEEETEAAETETEAADTEAAEEETGAAETEAETETETEDPAMIEAKAEAEAKAVEMLEKIAAGEDFEAAAEAVDPDAACATMTFGKDDTYIAPELIEATEGLEDGTLIETPIETDRGYYVAKVVSKLDREATDKQKETIVTNRKNDRVTELYEEWTEDGEIVTHNDVISQIIFDFSLTQETEAATEAETEGTTESATEAETEDATEAATEAVTEDATEAATEAETEGTTESATEAVTEDATEAATEAVTEGTTEAATEAVTE